jgi:hypothetical protein
MRFGLFDGLLTDTLRALSRTIYVCPKCQHESKIRLMSCPNCKCKFTAEVKK